MKIVHKRGHAKARQEHYPVTGDALDAIAAGFAALQEQGITIPAKTIDWLDRCIVVKKKYPKNT